MFKAKQQKNDEYDKRLYESDIIQELYNTINKLESRIEVLEKKNGA